MVACSFKATRKISRTHTLQHG